MNWELAGDLFLCFAILGGGTLFVVANINYKPDNEGEG